jgi:hypothetical protein
MACTKIFSGDLPELLSEIIQYFRNDFSTLHSCILVSRLWCRLTIPLLWENPFSIVSRKFYFSIEYHKIQFIDSYLVNLNDNDKIKLNEFGMNHLSLSNTLFNYPGFIKHLDTRLIGDCIEHWVAAVKKTERPKYSSIFIKNTQNLNFTKFIYKSLIKIFIEIEANLQTFDVTYHHHYFDIVSESILRSSNFICNIRTLNLNFFSYYCLIINVNPFIEFLTSNCNSISSLNFLFSNCKQTTEKHLSQLVDSQQYLKKIALSINSLPLYHSLLLLKNPNCTNPLRTIILYLVDFKNIVVSNEIFKQLNVLESIHILYCYLDSNFIRQIINLTEPFKLKSLFIDEQTELLIETLQLLLQKSGDYLENFGLELEHEVLRREVLELLIKYCNTKIKFLKFYEFDDQNIYKIFQSIEKVEQSLNYLMIDTSLYDDEFGSIVLQNLGQILPSKLEYFNLVLTISDTSDFEIFLKNSQNTFFEKLLIMNIRNEEQDKLGKMSVLPHIKEYIMKKRRTMYLAFQDYFFTQTSTIYDHDELYSLKNEVKEFRSHNIIVQNYHELKIEILEFVNEMY